MFGARSSHSWIFNEVDTSLVVSSCTHCAVNNNGIIILEKGTNCIAQFTKQPASMSGITLRSDCESAIYSLSPSCGVGQSLLFGASICQDDWTVCILDDGR